MSETVERRRVFLLVPHTDGTSVLVDDTGNLPSFVLELEPQETTILLAGRGIRELGLHGPVIDCFIDQTPQPEEARGVVPAVIELAAPGVQPIGTRWAPLDEVGSAVTPEVGDGLAGYVADRLDEWRGVRAVPAARSAWCRPGWYERVCVWIDGVLLGRGEGAAVAVTPFRQWGISAVLRVETAASRYWFKAVFPPFVAEPVVTEFLDRIRPGRVPRVIAVEAAEGWMLLGEMTGTTAAMDPEVTSTAIAALVDLQRGFIGRTDELLAGGFVDRSLQRLAGDLVAALDLPLVQAELRVDAARARDLERWLTNAVATVEAIGIPHTLVHGDFHPGNVMVTDDGLVLFDWSDAAVSHPLIDAAVWASWSSDDPAAVDELWRAFAAAWSELADPATVVAARRELDAITGAYHFVSYARILDGLEPCRRPEAMSGLTGFFELLDKAVPT